MKKKTKTKFLRNIVIGILALIIVAFIINIAPGYKRNKYQNIINLVIGDENVTEKLTYSIYKDENETVYISKEDITNLLDKTFYYDEANGEVVATSEVAVGSMQVGNYQVTIDNVTNDTFSTVIQKDNILYIPIEEMREIYNIDIQYVEDSNVIIIDKLNEGMIRAEAVEEADIRFKIRALSKKVGKLEVGDKVSAFYTTSKGWRLIRTDDGIVGYVKANVLTNEYIVRQDMGQKVETKKISVDSANDVILTLDGKNIEIKELFEVSNDGILYKNLYNNTLNTTSDIWATITIKDVALSKYSERTALIKDIVNIAMKNNIAGINVVINDNPDLERFTIELAPRLREIGILTNIITEKTEEEKYIGIVEYIIRQK